MAEKLLTINKDEDSSLSDIVKNGQFKTSGVSIKIWDEEVYLLFQ